MATIDIADYSTQIVRCPNCGNLAERSLIRTGRDRDGDRRVQTACEHCDYLMVTSLQTGGVIEAYAPGRYLQLSDRPHAFGAGEFKSIQAVL